MWGNLQSGRSGARITKPFDPYKELGVPRDADEGDIRRAYRRRAKATHPDAGGKREAFEAATRAVAILDDSERRRRYDETGSVDDDPMQSEWHAALSNIVPAGLAMAWARGQIDFESTRCWSCSRRMRSIRKVRSCG